MTIVLSRGPELLTSEGREGGGGRGKGRDELKGEGDVGRRAEEKRNR